MKTLKTPLNKKYIIKYYKDKTKSKHPINPLVERSINNIFSKSFYIKNVIFTLYILRNKKNMKNLRNKTLVKTNYKFTIKYNNFLLAYKYACSFLKNNKFADKNNVFLKIFNIKSYSLINQNINTKKLEYFINNSYTY